VTVKSAEWFFDFVSPFCYLQIEAFPSLGSGLHMTLTPVVLAGILKQRGQLGPAEIPEKRRFTYRFVQWLAERDRVPLRFPPAHPFNPIRALRLAIVAGGGVEPVRAIFRHLWREGRSLEEPADWRALCEQLGIADADVRISEPAVKNALRQNGERALAAGLFGVPTLVIDGELFWGADATGMALDYLRDPTRFATGEFRRVAQLPIGAERSRI
jgi:2-hydroxychromene-2-carboxylate isomerase